MWENKHLPKTCWEKPLDSIFPFNIRCLFLSPEHCVWGSLPWWPSQNYCLRLRYAYHCILSSNTHLELYIRPTGPIHILLFFSSTVCPWRTSWNKIKSSWIFQHQQWGGINLRTRLLKLINPLLHDVAYLQLETYHVTSGRIVMSGSAVERPWLAPGGPFPFLSSFV